MRGYHREEGPKNSFEKRDLRKLRQLISRKCEDEITETSFPNIGRDDQIDEETSLIEQTPPPNFTNHRRRMFSTNISVALRLHGINLGPGSEVFYTERGRLTSIFLGQETKIGNNQFSAGSITYFFKEGSIDWVSLSQDTIISTPNKLIPKLWARRLISFYRNGMLKETTLAADLELWPYIFPGGSVVHFSNDGRLVWAHLSHNTPFSCNNRELIALQSSCAEFHTNGHVRSIVLAKDTTIQGHLMTRGVQIHLDLEGNLSQAQVSVTTKQAKTTIKRNTAVRFRRDGSIREVTVT